MLHPSYKELMATVNNSDSINAESIVHSRYSIVMGAAKRARQHLNADALIYEGQQRKPLSIAIDEISKGIVHITGEGQDYTPAPDAAQDVQPDNGGDDAESAATQDGQEEEPAPES